MVRPEPIRSAVCMFVSWRMLLLPPHHRPALVASPVPSPSVAVEAAGPDQHPAAVTAPGRQAWSACPHPAGVPGSLQGSRVQEAAGSGGQGLTVRCRAGAAAAAAQVRPNMLVTEEHIVAVDTF